MPTKRAVVPVQMGQAILDAKRTAHELPYGNSAINIGGGTIVVPKRNGQIQIRSSSRGGGLNAKAKQLQGCKGKGVSCVRGVLPKHGTHKALMSRQ